MSVAFQDYYEILGVTRNATQAEIQKAYRKLARKYHPDVNKDKGAEDQFKKANEAYEVLKNPETRKKYDQLGSQWRTGDPFNPRGNGGGGGGQDVGYDFGDAFSGSGFSSFFDMLFGQKGQRQGATRQEDFGAIEQEATIEVTLEESLHGVEKELIVKPMGQGSEKHIHVRIPPGASEGSKIRLRGQGRSRVRAAKPGDLVLKVRLKHHPLFRPEGRDIVGTLVVTPWEAALGAKVSVPTLGKAVTLSVPAGTQSGQRLRLKGKGLPKPGGISGDIYYEVQIAIPKTLSDKEREAFEALASVSKFHPRG
jgi:curved DNA-binding protein